MTIEVALLISGVSLAFGIYQGITSLKRDQTNDAKTDASQLTTVIVKLENIGTGIARIEKEVTDIKKDVQADHERLVRTEESVKQAHNRITECKKQCQLTTEFFAEDDEAY